MHDDMIWGILSGLFGEDIARLLARFRYVIVFFVVTCAIYGLGFVGAIRAHGLHEGGRIFLSVLKTPVGVLAPAGCGLLAVVVAFIASIGTHRKKDRDG
jgi:hypothetical protein